MLLDRLGAARRADARGAPFGHEQPNLAFPLGVPATLDGDAGTLTLKAPALL